MITHSICLNLNMCTVLKIMICSLGIFAHSISLPLKPKESNLKLGINKFKGSDQHKFQKQFHEKETNPVKREKILSMTGSKALKHKIFSMTASKVLEHVTKEIAKKSCMLHGFRISCNNLDHRSRSKKRIPKESRKSNEQVNQMFV